MSSVRYSFLSSPDVLNVKDRTLDSRFPFLIRGMKSNKKMTDAKTITVKQLKTNIVEDHAFSFESVDIVCDVYGSILEDDEIIDTTKVLKVVRHPKSRIIPRHLSTTLPDITYPGETELRALLSCGHAMAADTLYQDITVQLRTGKSVLSCFSCNKEWDFQETSEKAQMSMDEKVFWGIKVSLNSLGDECPQCRYYCQRIARDNDRAVCMKCSRAGTLFEFCWKCKRKWTAYHKCQSKEEIQEMLRTCKTKTMPYSNIEYVPSIRVCPACGVLIEHLDMCKEMKCYQCKKSFCFVCLTMCTDGLNCLAYNLKCTVAPRQIIQKDEFN